MLIVQARAFHEVLAIFVVEACPLPHHRACPKESTSLVGVSTVRTAAQLPITPELFRAGADFNVSAIRSSLEAAGAPGGTVDVKFLATGADARTAVRALCDACVRTNQIAGATQLKCSLVTNTTVPHLSLPGAAHVACDVLTTAALDQAPTAVPERAVCEPPPPRAAAAAAATPAGGGQSAAALPQFDQGRALYLRGYMHFLEMRVLLQKSGTEDARRPAFVLMCVVWGRPVTCHGHGPRLTARASSPARALPSAGCSESWKQHL